MRIAPEDVGVPLAGGPLTSGVPSEYRSQNFVMRAVSDALGVSPEAIAEFRRVMD